MMGLVMVFGTSLTLLFVATNYTLSFQQLLVGLHLDIRGS